MYVATAMELGSQGNSIRSRSPERAPKFHQNFTGCSPECLYNFVIISNWSTSTKTDNHNSAFPQGAVMIRDLRRGLLHRGWFRKTISCLKQHGKQHRCHGQLAITYFLKPPPVKPPPTQVPNYILHSGVQGCGV